MWVAEIDGRGKWGIIKCSNLVKYSLVIGGTTVTVTNGLIQMNDGSLGGLVILQKVLDNLNALKNYIKQTLEPAVKNGIMAVGVGSAANGTTGATTFNSAVSAATIDFEDMENTNVKHG